MAKKKVISRQNMPTYLPIWSTLTAFLALDRWNAPQWLWGAVGLLFIIAWAASIYGMIEHEQTDIFKNHT